MKHYGNPFIIVMYIGAYFLLLYGYCHFIIPFYFHLGYQWNPNILRIVKGVILVFFISNFLPDCFQQPSDMFIHLLFIFPVLPMLVMYGATLKPGEFILVTVISYCIILMSTKIPFKLEQIKLLSFNAEVLVPYLAIFLVLYIVVIISFGGLNFLNFNIWKVYEYRRAASAILPDIFAYLSPLSGKVIVPLLLLIGVVLRKWHIIITSIVVSVLLFALTGHKGPLFYPFVALIVYFIFKQNKKIGAYLVPACLCLALVLSLSSPLTGKVGKITGTLFMRRTCFSPAKINFNYYDYFSNKESVLWAESKLSMGLVDYPYDAPSPKIIGRHYYRDGSSANTGWIGIGYMQAGFSGMILYAIIIGIILKIFDMFIYNKDPSFIAGVAVIPVMTLGTSSDIPTVMLTHGMLLLFILLSIFKLEKTN